MYNVQQSPLYTITLIIMKHFVRELLIPILMIVGSIVLFPFSFYSQNKSLKLQINEVTHESPSLKSNTTKMVTKVEAYNVNTNEKTQTVEFDYIDDGGRVSSIKAWGTKEILVGTEIDQAHLFFTKSGNTLILSGYSLDELGNAITQEKDYVQCELNEMGYISYEKEIGESSYTIYEYDELEQTIYSMYKSIEYNFTDEKYFDWENGDILNGYPNGGFINGSQIAHCEYYDYTDIVNKANIDFNKLLDTQIYNEDTWLLSLAGYVGKPNSHLIRGIKSSADGIPYVTYEYEFDSEGYVIQINEEKGGNGYYYRVYYNDNSLVDPDPTPSNPMTDDDLENAIEKAPEGTEENPTEIFVPSGGITLHKPIDINKHIRLKGGLLTRGQDNPYALLRIREGYSLDLDGITIDGKNVDQKDGSIVVYGKLRLRDGVILQNCSRPEINTPSGTICVGTKGYVRMDKGARIIDNIGSYGGAIYCEGTFEMYDGEISGNSSQIGTVIINSGGIMKMHGGKISGNKVSEGCGGVFIGENCQCWIYSGEISGNEDCDIYSWADIYSGSNANVKGPVWLTDGNKLQIIDMLKNDWSIGFVKDPLPGTIIATGFNGFKLSSTDVNHIHYVNDAYKLLQRGNDIILSDQETSVEEIRSNNAYIKINNQQVWLEKGPINTCFIIYGMNGKVYLTGQTDTNGQASFILSKGFYLLKSKGLTTKFVVK